MENPNYSWKQGSQAHNVGFQSDPLVRRVVKLALDSLLACLALVIGAALVSHATPQRLGLTCFVVMAMAINVTFQFYSQHYRAVGIEDARAILFGNLALLGGVLGVCILRPKGWPGREPSEVMLVASLLTGPLWLGLRMICSAFHDRKYNQAHTAPEGVAVSPRTIIVGAGRAGILLGRELMEHPRLRCEVVGFVDDALDKQGVKIHGIPVLGPTALLPIYIREQRATQVILGMAWVSGSKLKELAELARGEGAVVKTVPGILDLVGDRPWKPEVRDVAIEDLLRREPITLDTDAIHAAVSGRVVLITGGGGSIGSELARRVADFHPERLVLLGRGENSLWETQQELTNLFPWQEIAIALCDIRNPVRLRQVFKTWRPEVVLHAAAHKHVPILEENPEEAIENNIFGTRNVIEAALDWGTRTFVNVSTDKAVNPVNVLGVSKRIGELIVANEAQKAGPGMRLVSVRFGNVLGSRGSVIRIFKEQIRRGGPVTVTHPDMVRFFMTIPEAAQLVLQAGLLGDTGKIFALDMGSPIHIAEMAREMVRLSGYSPGVDMDIRYTGVRPGEKMSEELFLTGEEKKTQVHLKVLEAAQAMPDPELLEEGLRDLMDILSFTGRGRELKIMDCFQRLVPNYHPSPSGLGRFIAVNATTTPETAGNEKPVFGTSLPQVEDNLTAIA